MDLSTIAPMGAIASDFNEDGLLDLMVYFWGRTPVLYLRMSDGSAGSELKVGVRAEPSEKQLSPRAFVTRELVDSVQRWYSNSYAGRPRPRWPRRFAHWKLLSGRRADSRRQSRRYGSDARGKAKALNGGYSMSSSGKGIFSPPESITFGRDE